MACDITAGRNDSNCLDSLGGIKGIYIANYDKGKLHLKQRKKLDF